MTARRNKLPPKPNRPLSERDKNKGQSGDWFVYVLTCADGTLYAGITNDLERRLKTHNVGTASRYTRSRRPVRLAYREPAESRSAALRREAEIKGMDRRTKLALCRSAPLP